MFSILFETGPFSNPLSFLRSVFQPNDVERRHSLFFDENTGGPLGGFGTNATLKQTGIGSAYNQSFISCAFSYHDDLLVVDGGVGLELEDFTPTLTVD